MQQLPPEIEEGNIEYKLHLSNPHPDRFNKLVSQMKWRLAEGFGEAIYDIGVADNGKLIGLIESELKASLATLKRMANELEADCCVIREHEIDQDDKTKPVKKVAEVLVRKGLDNEKHFLEIRIAIIGGVDVGKSSLLGALSMNELDNGKGKSRLNLLRHRHEIVTGRTSSISRQIIGFDQKGTVINFATNHVTTWEQVCQLSTKVITFIDSPGHPKYQKTTMSGLTGRSPDYACLIINGNAGGLSDISKEHLMIAMVLEKPLTIVITKIDITTIEQLTQTIKILFKFLKSPGVKLMPVIMENEDDIMVSIPNFVASSSVTGENLGLYTKFLNLLPKSIQNYESLIENEVEYHIEEVYYVPDTGTVVAGLLVSGKITRPKNNQDQTYYIGPDQGRFVPVKIKSIHRQRTVVSYISAGQAGTCALVFPENIQKKKRKRSLGHQNQSNDNTNEFHIRRGQVILRSLPEQTSECAVCWEFEAEIDVLVGSLHIGNQVMIFTGSVSQSVKVSAIEFDLKVGERGIVTLKFMNEPQWLHSGWTLLIRQTDTKCIGKITVLRHSTTVE